MMKKALIYAVMVILVSVALLSFVSPNTGKYSSQNPLNQISPAAVYKNSVIHSVSVGKSPYAVAYDPQNGNMYVVNFNSFNVSVISPENKVIASVYVGQTPFAIAYDPANGEILVGNPAFGNVTVISSSNKVIGNINLNEAPDTFAYDPQNGNMYVANQDSLTVAVISPSNSVISNVNVGANQYGIAYDSANHDLYVAKPNSDNLSVISSSNSVIGTVNLGVTIGSGAFPIIPVAYDPANGNVYVGNIGSNTLISVSPSNTVQATVMVGSSPEGIAYDPGNENLYAANAYNGNVSVISPSGTVVASVAVGILPNRVAYSPENGFLYVCNFNSNNVSVISMPDSVYANTAVGSHATGIAYDSGNGYTYVASSAADKVYALTSTGSIAATLRVGSSPNGIAYDRSSGDVYVANTGSGNVSIISPANTVVASITVGTSPYGVAYDQNNNNIYVSNNGSDTVSVISPSNSVTATINVGTSPHGVSFDPANGNIYVADSGAGYVTVISSSNALSGNLSVGPSPYGVTYDPGNGYIYVSNHGSNYLSVISSSGSNVANVSAGSHPLGMAYDPGNSFMYIADNGSDTVSVISPSNYLVATLTVGSGPYGVAYNPGNGVIYTSNYASGNVSLVNTAQDLVQFTESGLPSGALWSVTLASHTYTLSSGTIAVSSPPGDFTYSVTSSNLRYSPSARSGTVAVTGSFTEVSVPFHPVNYTVEFTKSGLPSGTPWAVTLNGIQKSSTSNIYFNVTNGTYTYSISPLQGYVLSTGSYSSSITVSGSSQIISTNWIKATSAVNFKESGLPSGSWYINITGQSSSGAIAYSNAYSTSLPNGTYSYTVSTTDKLYEAQSSAFTVDGSQKTIAVKFTPVNYTVEFTKSGLPSGTPWTVTLNGIQKSSTSNIYFNVTNGTYAYTVSPVQGYGLSTGSYSSAVSVAGSPKTVSSTWVQSTANVTFVESGLPSGHWYVNITGQTTSGAISHLSDYNATLPNGTYSYSVSTTNKLYTSKGSTFTFDGSGKTIMVNFVPVLYEVQFKESGLPLNTPWSVTVNGNTQASTSSSLAFNLQNGSYAYSISHVKGYALSTGSYSGTVIVSGSAQTVTTSWVQAASSVTFKQAGLPSGSWYINITGQSSSGAIAYSGTYSTSLPNGTYSYTVSTTDRLYQAKGSTFTVDGSAQSITLQFTPVTYKVQFNESGLPPDTAWSVSIKGNIHTTTGYNQSLMLQNGTYTYSLKSSINTYAPVNSTGTVTVNGHNSSMNVNFSSVKYTLTVNEKGLPSGTSWSFSLGNYTKTSTTSTIAYYVLNGTYTYTTGSVKGYHTSHTGTVTVSGSSQTFTIQYTKDTYTLTVKETGLIAGTGWNFTLNGHVYRETGSSIVLQLTEGTYSINATGPSGYMVSVQSSVSISNSNTSVSVNFTQVQKSSASSGPATLYEALGSGIAVGVVVAAIGTMFATGTGIFRKRGKGGNP